MLVLLNAENVRQADGTVVFEWLPGRNRVAVYEVVMTPWSHHDATR